MDRPVNELRKHIEHDLSLMRDELTARHGVSHLDVQVELDASQKRATLRGTVLVDRLRTHVVARVEPALPSGWTAVCEGLKVVQGGAWFSVERPLSLFDRHADARGHAGLVTEVLPADGPLEQLGRFGSSGLWRDRFGTVGWEKTDVGPACNDYQLPTPTHPNPIAFVAAARRYLDIPYRLGGTSVQGIDCSALIQRAAWAGLRVALPRNSGDLWALGARDGAPPSEPGHLVFTWTDDESLRHVALTDHDTMVHASLSRRRVVEDPRARFVEASNRLAWVPFEVLTELGQRSAGLPNVLAAGVRLGVVD